MQFFSSKESPIISALLAVIEITDSPWVRCDNINDAKLIFVIDDRAELARLYRKDKVFAYFSVKKGERNLPANVIQVGLNSVINDIQKVIEYAQTFKPPGEVKKTHRMPETIVKTSDHYRVLVIDDTPENLDFAQALLGQDHEVVVANGFAEGMRQLASNAFDFVLSDMQMPGNKHYSALSDDAYRLDETYEYGMLVVFEATARGIPTAIVTDANHHGSWMSAALDHLKQATVNGKPVRFFNNIGKRWDTALAELEKALDN